MSSTFPHTRSSRLGYDADEVDDFLDRARQAYTSQSGDAKLSASGIRRAAFTMRKGGYDPEQVDAALERLEDAFASRERENAIAVGRQDDWYGGARGMGQEILDRLVRPVRHRFRRVGPFVVGYDPRDVDPLADRIADFLQTGAALTPQELRQAVFRPRRGGYSEAQVDALIDSTVAVLLAVR